MVSESTGRIEGDDEPASSDAVKLGSIENVGEPIRLTDVNIHGITAEAAQPGGKVRVWTRMVMASDQPIFHRVARNFVNVIEHSARLDGQAIALDRAHTVLLVMHPDNTGELWIDTAAVMMDSVLKRGVVAGSVIFERDIADIRGMWFPCVNVGPKDRVICLFREGWRFGLFFDFNPDGDLSIDDARRELGMLFRRLKYAELFEGLANETTFKRLIESGWFPFIEIIGGEFRALMHACEAGFDLELGEAQLLHSFNEVRLEGMFERWIQKPHFKAKERILRSAINSFKGGDAIATLKTVLSEIEGVLAAAHFAMTGKRTRKLKELVRVTIEAAQQKAGAEDSLFLPTAFATYLADWTYADFDLTSTGGSAGSRHAVGHGMADQDTYTQARALQALLTLDQLAFYT